MCSITIRSVLVALSTNEYVTPTGIRLYFIILLFYSSRSVLIMIHKSNPNKNRINTACEFCKKKKVKCDRGRPCSNCIRFNQNCMYPIKHYLSHLKNTLTTTIPSSSSSYLNPNIDIPLSPSPYFTFSIDKYRFHRRYQNVLPYLFADNLIQQLSPSVIKQWDLERPRIQNYTWNMAGGHFPKFGDPCFLNEPHFFDFKNTNHINLIKKILQWYFNHCNPIFGILHESVFYSQLNNKFLPNLNPVGKSNKLFQSLLYLIIIITIRFNAGLISRNNTTYTDLFPANGIVFENWEFNFLFGAKAINLEQHLFVYSYDFIQKLTFEWESFELIQSWLLIAFYLRTCHRQTSTWNALSKAISLVKGMSLEMNMFPSKHHPYDEMKASHCFWSCFIMDKIISFQMGRTFQLELPLNNMPTPRHTITGQVSHPMSVDGKDDWFHEETRQMYDLSLIIYKFQQYKCFEMELPDSIAFRKHLSEWIQANSVNVIRDNLTVLQLQPLFTYLDITLTFEIRSLLPIACHQLSNSNSNSAILPLDSSSLLTHVQMTLDLLTYLCTNNLFFVPWWLQLSNLFTITLISLICSYSNLQTLSYRHILSQISRLWKIVKNATPWNPPVMLKQCDWCIKMLNHMIILIIQDSTGFLSKTIGIDHGDNTPNQNNFQQFNRVEENEEEQHESKPTVHKDQNNTLEQIQEVSTNAQFEFTEESMTNTTDSLLSDDLLATLHWFDENFL